MNKFKVLVTNADSNTYDTNSKTKITKDATNASRAVTSLPTTLGQIRKMSTHTRGNAISPTTKKDLRVKSFFTMDIETISVDACMSAKAGKHFLIDHQLLQHNIDDAVAKLWSVFYEYLTTLSSYSLTIYVHNLGGFDGIFIFKYLASISNDPSMVDTIIDGSNKFITISYNGIVFKDSYRVFPVSLQELCGIFNVTGKSNVYKEEYSNIQVFSNPALLQEFISYGMQDSIALYNALVKAQELYHSKYQVDITTIVSLPALALKIFRMKFLNKLIPILNGMTDRFIRGSYYGGAVDYYKAYGENLHYYDVNSLYPYAMLKPMPLNLIRSIDGEQCNTIDINEFYGFLEVDVECPDFIKKPVLPLKYKGKTIYPRGKWTSTYFSHAWQELKEVIKLGYKIHKIHHAKEFEAYTLFNDYILEMYQLKKVSKGGMHDKVW